MTSKNISATFSVPEVDKKLVYIALVHFFLYIAGPIN